MVFFFLHDTLLPDFLPRLIFSIQLFYACWVLVAPLEIDSVCILSKVGKFWECSWLEAFHWEFLEINSIESFQYSWAKINFEHPPEHQKEGHGNSLRLPLELTDCTDGTRLLLVKLTSEADLVSTSDSTLSLFERGWRWDRWGTQTELFPPPGCKHVSYCSNYYFFDWVCLWFPVSFTGFKRMLDDLQFLPHRLHFFLTSGRLRATDGKTD